MNNIISLSTTPRSSSISTNSDDNDHKNLENAESRHLNHVNLNNDKPETSDSDVNHHPNSFNREADDKDRSVFGSARGLKGPFEGIPRLEINFEIGSFVNGSRFFEYLLDKLGEVEAFKLMTDSIFPASELPITDDSIVPISELFGRENTSPECNLVESMIPVFIQQEFEC